MRLIRFVTKKSENCSVDDEVALRTRYGENPDANAMIAADVPDLIRDAATEPANDRVAVALGWAIIEAVADVLKLLKITTRSVPVLTVFAAEVVPNAKIIGPDALLISLAESEDAKVRAPALDRDATLRAALTEANDHALALAIRLMIFDE